MNYIIIMPLPYQKKKKGDAFKKVLGELWASLAMENSINRFTELRTFFLVVSITP